MTYSNRNVKNGNIKEYHKGQFLDVTSTEASVLTFILISLDLDFITP